MTTFEVKAKTTNETKYGIKLINGTCLWFDTREDRDFYYLMAQ